MTTTRTKKIVSLASVLCIVAFPVLSRGQERIKTMPGYEQFQKMYRENTDAVKMGSLQVKWEDGGKAFTYSRDARKYRYDIAARSTSEASSTTDATPVADSNQNARAGRGRAPNSPERGRQFASSNSPDEKFKAFHRDRILWISNADGSNDFAVTTDGTEKGRIKYGIASWVYGEELRQTTAMWWSPDSKRIAFYRFDESKVPDYYLQLDQTKIQSKMDIEAYPKAGAPNPIADLFVYDLASKKTTQIDVRDGKPFDNSVVGHYVYHVSWSPDGTELLFNRTNRRQNIMEFVASNPETGKCRVIVREEWPASWTENSPAMQFLKDGKRFVWASERTSWRNLYLYDLSGKQLAALTGHNFEVASITKVDDEAGVVYYMARDGDNPMKLQLHRVRLDGTGDRRLTDPAYTHSVDIAPDGRHFIDVAQTHDIPPFTRLMDSDGNKVDELAKSDTTKFEQLGLKRVELFKFK